EWMKKCPLENYKNFLIEKKIFTSDELTNMKKKINGDVEDAFLYAKSSDYPGREEIYEDLFK
ncbi:hypothetical protein KY317_03640, partial [Candidatus Woesearchaeota archaeon]|nr:hypothetical protein [Candidatus Woesearchaeota archaeon]